MPITGLGAYVMNDPPHTFPVDDFIHQHQMAQPQHYHQIPSSSSSCISALSSTSSASSSTSSTAALSPLDWTTYSPDSGQITVQYSTQNDYSTSPHQHNPRDLANYSALTPFDFGESEQQLLSRNSLVSSSIDSSSNGTSADHDEADEEAESASQEQSPQWPMMPIQRGGGGGGPRKERQKKRPNQCAVCGRAAVCCHFDVPSCLGCRSFFRRTVLSQREYHCMKGGNCQLVQGEICRSCRFKGCILAGMNPYSIRAQSSQTIQMKEGIQFFERQKGQLLKGLTKAATSSNSKEDIFIEMTEPYEKTNSQTMELKLEPFIPGHAESQLLNWLLDVDEKMLRIRYSETEIRADSYYTKSLYDILQDGENLLAKAETFSGDRRMARSLQYYVSQIEQGNMDFMKISWLFIDVFLCFQLAKTIPAIRELSIEDQTTLLANNALTAVVMNQSYYSLLMQNELDLMVFPNGFSPICFTRNPSINSIKRKLFDKNLRPYKRIELSREEFLLLRVIQLLQTAPANLSKAGCNTLQAHLEKYSKLLMHYERSRLGHLGGVQRYAELMFFTSAVRNIGYEHQNFLAYMTTVMMKEGPLKTDQPHPDYMDNVIFGIVGKIKREEQQAEVPRPWINSQAAKFIRDNF